MAWHIFHRSLVTPITYHNDGSIVATYADDYIVRGKAWTISNAGYLATVTSTGTQILKHAAFASSTGASSCHSAEGGSLSSLIINSSKKYLITIENTGSSATDVEYDATIYEV